MKNYDVVDRAQVKNHAPFSPERSISTARITHGTRMSDELICLAGRTDEILTTKGKVTPACLPGADLAWAAYNLRAARIGHSITARLEKEDGLEALQSLLQVDQGYIYEVAAMSLGFGDIMTALALCGSALDVIERRTPYEPDDHVADIGKWFGKSHGFPKKRQCLPSEMKTWLDELESDCDWPLLKRCRHPIVHRRFHRTLALSSLKTGLTLVKIDLTLDKQTDPTTANPEDLRDIGELIYQLLLFGEGRFRRFCAALQISCG